MRSSQEVFPGNGRCFCDVLSTCGPLSYLSWFLSIFQAQFLQISCQFCELPKGLPVDFFFAHEFLSLAPSDSDPLHAFTFSVKGQVCHPGAILRVTNTSGSALSLLTFRSHLPTSPPRHPPATWYSNI